MVQQSQIVIAGNTKDAIHAELAQTLEQVLSEGQCLRIHRGDSCTGSNNTAQHSTAQHLYILREEELGWFINTLGLPMQAAIKQRT